MSTSHRSRYVWAFLTRPFTRRLDTNERTRRDARQSIETTLVFTDTRALGLSVGRSTEMVPGAIDYDAASQTDASSDSTSSSASVAEHEVRSTITRTPSRQAPPQSQEQQTIGIITSRARRIGSELLELVPFQGGADEPPLGDDPTFQQLLCLAGVFCGPLMYLIGGVLFCVIPREHRQTRRWALFNLILAICSFFYLASTGSIESIQRP